LKLSLLNGLSVSFIGRSLCCSIEASTVKAWKLSSFIWSWVSMLVAWSVSSSFSLKISLFLISNYLPEREWLPSSIPSNCPSVLFKPSYFYFLSFRLFFLFFFLSFFSKSLPIILIIFKSLFESLGLQVDFLALFWR